MKIYTSYFSNGAKLSKDGIVMIGIALYPPKWFMGQSIKYVSPSWDILHNAKSKDDYIKRFNIEILSKRDPMVFLSNIEKMANGKDVALCCFEKPEEFCHRHLVADWLNKNLGLNIEEYGISCNPTYTEQNLF